MATHTQRIDMWTVGEKRRMNWEVSTDTYTLGLCVLSPSVVRNSLGRYGL